MNTLQPVSVALKFGFLAVLYLFLLWVARSALSDLRGRDRTHPPAGYGAAAGGRAMRPLRMRPACSPPPRSGAPTSPVAPPAWWSPAPAVTIRG